MADPHISEIWRNWALVAGGTAGIIGGVAGLGIAIWRGYAANVQSKASRSQADTAQRAHITEVYKDAVGQLSGPELEIRLGAIFTLIQIHEDFPEFQHYVFQVLSAYAKRRTAGADPEAESPPDIKEILDFLRENLGQQG